MPSLNIIGNINLTGGEYKKNPFIATGGQIATFTSGGINYTSHTFTSSGVFTILNGESTAQVLAVGSGGKGTNGGSANTNGNAGGGGGIAYTSSFFFRKNYTGGPSTFIASVGTTNETTSPSLTGSSTVFYSTYGYEQIAPIIAYGGGDGTQNGASGGGSFGLAVYGVQGKNGAEYQPGGGGGAGVTGSFREGGNGLVFTLQDGTSQYYAGGGGGGGYSNIGPTPGGAGGLGGGGTGGAGVSGDGLAGTPNTGGGGGGGNTANDAADRGEGGAGGSGIVVICYPTNGI